MSITFTTPNAPITILDPRACDCDQWFEGEGFDPSCQCCFGTGTWRCWCVGMDPFAGAIAPENCPDCHGTGEGRESVRKGEFNVNNRNGRDLLAMLGLSTECAGEIAPEQFPALRHRIMRMRASANTRAPFVLDWHESGGDVVVDRSGAQPQIRRTARCFEGNRPDEDILRHINQFETLLVVAQELGDPIYWG